MNQKFQSGFVNIFGAPNAGKSTLLNALLGERLVIVSHKVQTTRHRILGILNEAHYQIVFSDTPGIIEPKYKLHEKMMRHVKSALEDADVAILVHDITHPEEEIQTITDSLRLKVPALLVLNKADLIKDKNTLEEIRETHQKKFPKFAGAILSSLTGPVPEKLIPLILKYLPEAPPYYPEDSMSDRPVRFFVSELIREQIYNLYHEEIPYHSAVIIQSFEEKQNISVIKAEIIVARETQKIILL